MKYKNVMVVVLLSVGSVVFSVSPSSEVRPVGSEVRDFFAGPAVNDMAAIVSGGINDTAAVISAGITDVKNHLEVYNKKIIDGAVPNLGSTLTAKEQTAGVSKVKSTFESIKKNAMSVFSPKPAAALEQGKVPTPKQEEVKVEEKSLLTQISENPGTTAALTAGTVVALYGSYKLIQYFDNKRAKKIALAKRLKAQRMQQSVVFE